MTIKVQPLIGTERVETKTLVWTGTQWMNKEHVCYCKFVAPDMPLDSSNCPIHKHEAPFGCDCCEACSNYRPHHEFNPISGNWPLCVCGHCAQDHNWQGG